MVFIGGGGAGGDTKGGIEVMTVAYPIIVRPWSYQISSRVYLYGSRPNPHVGSRGKFVEVAPHHLYRGSWGYICIDLASTPI